MKLLSWGASILVIVVLGYFLFPGHTYLQSDTQIYVPMLERALDPGLFTRDITVLRPHLTLTAYDETASIGKRYRRQDEVGTPFCVTVDFDSLDDRAVTVRERDSMAQERIAIGELVPYVLARLG